MSNNGKQDGYDSDRIVRNKKSYRILYTIDGTSSSQSTISGLADIDHGTVRNIVPKLEELQFIRVCKRRGREKIYEINERGFYRFWNVNSLDIIRDAKEEFDLEDRKKEEIEKQISDRDNLYPPIPRPNEGYEDKEAEYYTLEIVYQGLRQDMLEDIIKQYTRRYLDEVKDSTIENMLFEDLSDAVSLLNITSDYHTNFAVQCLLTISYRYRMGDAFRKRIILEEVLDETPLGEEKTSNNS